MNRRREAYLETFASLVIPSARDCKDACLLVGVFVTVSHEATHAKLQPEPVREPFRPLNTCRRAAPQVRPPEYEGTGLEIRRRASLPIPARVKMLFSSMA